MLIFMLVFLLVRTRMVSLSLLCSSLGFCFCLCFCSRLWYSPIHIVFTRLYKCKVFNLFSSLKGAEILSFHLRFFYIFFFILPVWKHVNYVEKYETYEKELTNQKEIHHGFREGPFTKNRKKSGIINGKPYNNLVKKCDKKMKKNILGAEVVNPVCMVAYAGHYAALQRPAFLPATLRPHPRYPLPSRVDGSSPGSPGPLSPPHRHPRSPQWRGPGEGSLGRRDGVP